MSNIRAEWTVLSMLNWATDYFEQKKINSPRLSIEWILAHVLERKRLDLYLIFDRPLHQNELDEIRPLVKRRANHEPLQYVIGQTDFFGLTFLVKPGVLIPRPETEQLVEIVLNELSEKESASILDIGTGSGCIPITLKKQNNTWTVKGIDISEEALSIAKENAELNKTDVLFSKDDFFNPSSDLLNQSFDIIISNPPYIEYSEYDNIDEEVKSFEPEIALFTKSAYDVYHAIQEFAAHSLSKNGVLALELNERMGHDIMEIFSSKRWDAKLIKDYSKKDRFIVAKKCV